jgi:hypothetical protein
MIDLLCRLKREIATTQAARNNSRRSLGPTYDPVRVKDRQDQTNLKLLQTILNKSAGPSSPDAVQ